MSEWRHQCAVSFRFLIRLDSSPLERHSRFHYENNPTGISAGVERREKGQSKKWPYRISRSLLPIRHAHTTSIARWRPVGELNNAVCTSRYRRIVYTILFVKPSRLLLLPSLSTSFSFEFFLGVIIFLPTVSLSQSRSFSVTVWEIPPGRRCRRLPLRPLPLTHCTSTRPHGLNFCVSVGRVQTLERSETNNSWLYFFHRYYREEENRRFASRKIGKKNKVLYYFCFPTFSFLHPVRDYFH